MFQITNSSYRFRKRKLTSKTAQISSFTAQNRAQSHPNYLQTFKNTQNISFNLSIPKNIKILPKLQKTFLYSSNNCRYIHGPSTPSNQSSLGRFQTSIKDDIDEKSNHYFFRSQKNAVKQRVSETRPGTDWSLKLASDLSKQIHPRYFFANKQGKRPYNEDRFICKNDIHKFYFKNHLKKQTQTQEQIDLYSVFDGHGGVGCAEFLKDNFINFLIRTKNLDTNPEESLREAFAVSQEKFLAICESTKFGTERSGACAVSCIVTEHKVVVGSVGDCRALMFNKDFLCEMTKDHKPTETSQKMRILKCGGKVYKQQTRLSHTPGQPIKFFTSTRIAPGNLNVSRTLGDIETKLKKYGGLPGMISAQPEIRTFQKQNYQILLLASDGLFEAFTNVEVQRLYYKIAQSQKRNGLTAGELAKRFLDRLVEQALERSTDNVTVVVVPLGDLLAEGRQG